MALARRWYEAAATGELVTTPIMVPASAAGVLLCAAGMLLVRPPRNAAARRVGRLMAAAALALGLLVMGQFAADWGSGEVRGMLIAGGSWLAQRPSPTTGLGLALVGTSVVALGSRHERGRRWAPLWAAAALMVALVGLIGHAYGASMLYGLDRWGGTAVSTGVAIGAIASGVFFGEPWRGFAALLASDGAGGHLLRRLLPAALMAPPLLGWLALTAEQFNLIDYAFATGLLVVSLVALLVALIARQARVLDAVDVERGRHLQREREARAQATTILESITDAFFAVDREWRFTYVNREAERLLRRPREGLLGRSLWAEFPEAVGAAFQREYQRAMLEQETVHFEAHYPPLDIWVDVRAFPAAEGLSVYFRDVTASKLEGEKIRESEARFRALAENATVAIFVIDEESTIEFANPAVERIFGYRIAELLGRSLNVLMPEDQRALHDAGLRQYLETGQRHIPWEGFDMPGVTKDGRTIPLEISIGDFARKGRHYFTGIARDVSERKRAEEALRESEERYRLLADMIPQHIWATEADGYHSYFSRRWYEFTGATPEQTRGEGWLSVLHPADRERTVERWHHSLRTGEPYAIEYRFRSAGGDYCWFLGQAMPLRDESGEIIRWFGTLTDISERKRLEEERERLLGKEQAARAEAERRREELERVTESRASLMRGFSHDVKNPLGTAHIYAELLERGGISGELSAKQRESVQRIRRSIRTSVGLIDDLLELARAETGQLDLKCEKTEVGQAARELTEDFRAQASAVGVALEVRAPAELQARTDPTRLRQILTNLLSNALKHAPEGQVTVDAGMRRSGGPRPGDWVAVSVTDSGPGIPEDKQELIFQEYARLNPDATRGAGIGLAISRHVARLLGGDLTVTSELGRGSTFTLWMPPLV